MPKTMDWSALSDEYASNTPEIISEVTHPAREFTVEDLSPIHPDDDSGRHGTGTHDSRETDKKGSREK